MKKLFTFIIIYCASVTLAFGQGAEGFNKFREKANEYGSGSFIGENGINWDYTACKKTSVINADGLEKSRLLLSNDSTSEINSSVISGGIGFLRIAYTTLAMTPVKLDVFVNRVKIATLTSPASENTISNSSADIPVNMDRPFYIRIKQADYTSGEVVIEKVLWSKFASKDYGILPNDIVPTNANATNVTVINNGFHSEYASTYHVYPNPAKEYVVIEMTENHDVTFKLFTLSGQMIIQEQIKASGQKIGLNNLKEGLYIYKIIDDKGKQVTGKLVLR
ncbi:MAG: T9SS type A sorting domain-containing protein [Bacteroidota bacterium]|nr:T9SS type A sorting domain-containing protein [Bacteroidota bacterium]